MSNGHASHGAQLLPESGFSAIERLGVELRDPDVLRTILRGNPELTDLVLEAAGELQGAFGDRATIALEHYIDPEFPGAQPRVFVLAVTSLSFRDADEILDRILEGWWADNHSRADCLVSLATEFV